MERAKGIAVGTRMKASTNLPQIGHNVLAEGRLDGNICHEIGSESNTPLPYPRLTFACHAGRDLDVVANGA